MTIEHLSRRPRQQNCTNASRWDLNGSRCREASRCSSVNAGRILDGGLPSCPVGDEPVAEPLLGPGRAQLPGGHGYYSRVARIRWLLPALVIGWSVVGIGLAASVPGSPLVHPHGGVEALGVLEDAAARLPLPSSSDALLTLTMFLACAAAVGFLIAARQAWGGSISVKWAVVVGVVLHVLVLPAPILFTNDVYNYVMYGRIVSEHGGNPYVSVPADFPDDPFLARIRHGDEGYGDERSVYGPAHTAFSAAVTATTSSVPTAVWIFRMIAALSSIATMLLAMIAARRMHPERAAFAVVVIGWNPLVILHAVGGAHNDTFVGLSLAAGALLALSLRFRAATFCLALGALVKVVVAGPLVVLIAGAVALAPKRKRLSVLSAHIGVAAIAVLPFVIPFFQTENPTLGALPASGRFWQGSSAIRDIMQAVGLNSIAEPLARLAQGSAPFVMLAATVLVALHLLRRELKVDPGTILGGMGWVMLVIFLFTDNHALAWYGMWIVPLAWVLPRVARSAVLLTSVALAPIHPWAFEGGRENWVLWGSMAVIYLLLLRVTVDLGLRLASKTPQQGASPLMDEESVQLPKILTPLRWLDAAAPPASIGFRSSLAARGTR